MKDHVLLLGSVLWLALVLVACGGSAPTSMPGMNRGTHPMPSNQSGTSTSGTRMTTVRITETEFKIASSVTSFTPGTTYHFVVTNEGKTDHELMLMPRSEGNMKGRPMGDMDRMALASLSDLAPGETKTLDYTFASSSAGSHPEFACYFPGHYEAGMKLDVSVKA